jgi:hypothetical protein
MKRSIGLAAALVASVACGPVGKPVDATLPSTGDIRPVPHPDPVLLEYAAAPRAIRPGQRSVLQWRGEGFGTVQIAEGPFVYSLPLAAGSHIVEPAETTTYTLSTHGLHGEGHAYQVTVEVGP